MQYTKRVFNIGGVQLVDLYKSVSLWDPWVHFLFCGTRCYSLLMLTVWANDSKHTVVRPYTLPCVMSNKGSLDTHTLQIIYYVSPYQWFFFPPIYWELWPGCHVGAVVCSEALCCRLSSPFSLFYDFFLPCWPLHRLWRLFTCFLVTNLPYTAAFLTTGSSGSVEVNNWMWKHLGLSVGKTQVAIFYR